MIDFNILNNYQISKELFSKYLNVYKLIGKYSVETSNFIKNNKLVLSKNIELETYYLGINYLKLNVGENRTKLIISKNSNTRNKDELYLANVKKIIINFYQKATNKEILNSSDLLDIIKLVSNKKPKFNNSEFLFQTKNKSVRYIFNELLNQYYDLHIRQKEEPLMMLAILICQMHNIKPYSENNELALILLYYYLLLYIGFWPLKYVSFFQIFDKYRQIFFNELIKGSINYDQGVIYFTPLVNITLDIINEAYNEFSKIEKRNYQESRARKTDYVRQSIIYDLPKTFSKDDIVNLYPDVSLSSIMRVLTELHNKNYIMPLGKGRSAKWQRIIDPDSLEFILGGNFDDDDK